MSELIFECCENYHNAHEIKSNNILTESDTGRVVAVFYNDYDLAKINEMQSQLQAAKAKIKELEQLNSKLSQRIYEHNCRLIGTPTQPKESE